MHIYPTTIHIYEWIESNIVLCTWHGILAHVCYFVNKILAGTMHPKENQTFLHTHTHTLFEFSVLNTETRITQTSKQVSCQSLFYVWRLNLKHILLKYTTPAHTDIILVCKCKRMCVCLCVCECDKIETEVD